MGGIFHPWDNDKGILGLYGDNGKEHGNDYNGILVAEAREPMSSAAGSANKTT